MRTDGEKDEEVRESQAEVAQERLSVDERSSEQCASHSRRSSPSSSQRLTCSCCFNLAIHAIAMFASASRSRALGMRSVVSIIVSLVLREHV